MDDKPKITVIYQDPPKAVGVWDVIRELLFVAGLLLLFALLSGGGCRLLL